LTRNARHDREKFSPGRSGRNAARWPGDESGTTSRRRRSEEFHSVTSGESATLKGDIRVGVKPAYSVEKLALGAATKNLGRFEAMLSRGAEGLPLESADLTWIASDRLEGNT